MQCTVCKKQDTLSNLVAVKLSETTTGYAHQKCINRHNRAAAQNLREFDAAMIASEIFAYDIDATYPYAVETFLHDHKQHKQRLSRGRYPTIPEIVAAAHKQRERENREAAFKTIEEKVGPLPAEADEALISEIAEELGEFSFPDEGEHPNHYAARLLTLQVAWRKDKEAFDAAAEDYERSEREAEASW